MADIEKLNDEVLEGANGGANGGYYINRTDWRGAHWRPLGHNPGEVWNEFGITWYMIKKGDTLSGIAARFGYTVQQLVNRNPLTITNPDVIKEGDAIALNNI